MLKIRFVYYVRDYVVVYGPVVVVVIIAMLIVIFGEH